jgi:hypothetical protein
MDILDASSLSIYVHCLRSNFQAAFEPWFAFAHDGCAVGKEVFQKFPLLGREVSHHTRFEFLSR